MAKTVREVANDPKFLALSPEDRAAVIEHLGGKDRGFLKLQPADREAIKSHIVSLPAPPRDVAWGEVPGAVYANFPGSAKNLETGMKDMAMHPITTAQTLGGIAAGGAMNLMTPDLRAMVTAKSPVNITADTQGMIDSANAAGQYARNRVLHPVNALATDPVGFAADLSTVAAGGAGLARGAMGAARAAGATRAARVASGARGVLDKTAAVTNPINWVAKPAGWALSPAGAFARKMTLGPVANTMLDATEGQANAVGNALMVPREIVPGSKPTAAQAVAHRLNQPKFAALGQDATKNLPREARAIKNAQNEARLAELRQWSGTPTQLEDAITIRDSVANHHYGLADKVVTPTDATLAGLMKAPVMQEAFARAELGFKNARRPFGTTVPVRGRFGQTIPAYTGEELHRVKMALDDVIKDPEQFGIGASDVKDIRKTRNEFIKWIEDNNSHYGDARRTYRDASTPINQMQIGQYLTDKLMNPTMAEDTAALRADSFSNAINESINGDRAIKSATGRQLFHNLSDILTPDQMRSLESVRADMARAKLAESQAADASRFGNVLENTTNPVRAPGLLHRGVTLFNAGTDRITNHLNEMTRGVISNAMMTPEGAGELLTNAMVRRDNIGRNGVLGTLAGDVAGQRAGDVVGSAGRLTGWGAHMVMRYPAVYQALQAQDNAPAAPPTSPSTPADRGYRSREAAPAPNRGGSRSPLIRVDPRGPAAQWSNHVENASRATGVPVAILDGVMRQESGGQQVRGGHTLSSPAGALGLMQLMPGTAAGLHVNPHDPAQNILGGAKYLKAMHDKFGSWILALAAYNAGPGALRPSKQNPNLQVWEAPYNSGYAETRNYVKNIKADIARRYGDIK